MKRFVVQTTQAGSDCRVRILHDPADPCSWIVHREQKKWFGYRVIGSEWFNLRAQAEASARLIVTECGRERPRR